MRLMAFLSIFVISLFIGMVFLPFIYADNENMESVGWGQYGHDAQHTWRADSVGPTSYARVLWERKIYSYGDEILSYKNYLITIGWGNGHEYAKVFDTNDMRQIASFPASKLTAVYRGIIYTVKNSTITAYNFQGNILWNSEEIFSPAIIQISEKGIFVLGGFLGNYDTKVLWISFSGEIKKVWKIGNITAPPVIYKDNLYLSVSNCSFFSTSSPSFTYKVYILNLTNNETNKISGFGNNESMERMAVDGNGNLYILSRNFNDWHITLYAINSNGSVRWKFIMPRVPLWRMCLAVGTKFVYLFAYNNTKPTIILLQKDDGKVIRQFNVCRKIKAFMYNQALIDRDGNIYLLIGNTICSYSPLGRLNWMINITGHVGYVPQWEFYTVFLLSNGYIYLLTAYGYLYKIGCPPAFSKDIYTVIIPIFVVVFSLLILGVWRWNKKEVRDEDEKM